VELSERFGLRLEQVDRAKLDEIRRGTELGSNPFDHLPLALVSVDFLKQERILDQLERTSYDRSSNCTLSSAPATTRSGGR
jgi:hypothetical protein